MQKLLSAPLFLVGLTVCCYLFTRFIYKKYPLPVLHPVLVSAWLIILFLQGACIRFTTYEQAARLISFLLGPATVALGFNLYRYMPVVRRRALPILLGSLAGAVSGVVSVLLLGRALGLGRPFILSLLPKSTTTPIAVAVSARLEGIGSLTVSAVIVTGILGAMMGPEFLTLIGVRSRIARGVAIGSAAHAIGTSRALQEDREQGTMAGIAIILAGLFTALLAALIAPAV